MNKGAEGIGFIFVYYVWKSVSECTLQYQCKDIFMYKIIRSVYTNCAKYIYFCRLTCPWGSHAAGVSFRSFLNHKTMSNFKETFQRCGMEPKLTLFR